MFTLFSQCDGDTKKAVLAVAQFAAIMTTCALLNLNIISLGVGFICLMLLLVSTCACGTASYREDDAFSLAWA